MKNRFLKLIQSLSGTEMSVLQSSAWHPLVDIYRYKHGWLVKCELAGIRIEDLKLSVKGHQLKVQGIRRDWLVQEGNQSYSMEILYNRFERSIELPCNLEGAQIIKEYRDGMLLIQLQTEDK
jgi:HSP20 family protein